MNELDDQDRKVLRLYAQNKTISQVAEALGVRFEAAHFHVRRLHERFGTSRRHELLEAARREFGDK